MKEVNVSKLIKATHAVKREIDMTHMCPILTVTREDFIFTETPTMEMINQAKDANQIVVSFFEIESFGSLDQYMKRFELEPSTYCMLVPKFTDHSLEELKEFWLERYLPEFNTQPSIWYAPAGIKREELKCVSLSQEAGL